MFKSSWNKLPLTLGRESVAITIPASPWQRFYIFFTVDVFFLPTCFVGLALGLWLLVVMGCSFRGEGLGWMLEFGEPLKPRHKTKPLVFFLCIFWAEGRGWFVVVVLCCVVLCFVLVFYWMQTCTRGDHFTHHEYLKLMNGRKGCLRNYKLSWHMYLSNALLGENGESIKRTTPRVSGL